MHIARPLAAVLAALALAGCAAPAPSATTAPLAPAASVTPLDADAMLARHGLAGLTPKQIVEKLDQTNDDRAGGVKGSVRPTQVRLTDDTGTYTLPLNDDFYFAVAPYVNETHECFNHNTASCQGELANTPVHLTIKDSAGKVLVDKDATTYANGFVSTWLPAGIKGHVWVSANGKSGSVPFGTGPDDATCVTTLQLR